MKEGIGYEISSNGRSTKSGDTIFPCHGCDGRKQLQGGGIFEREVFLRDADIDGILSGAELYKQAGRNSSGKIISVRRV